MHNTIKTHHTTTHQILFHIYWVLYCKMLSFLTLIGRTMYFHSRSRRTSQSKSQHVWNKNIIPWKARMNDFYSFLVMHQKTHSFVFFFFFWCITTREWNLAFVRTFHVIISVLVAYFTLRSHNEAQITYRRGLGWEFHILLWTKPVLFCPRTTLSWEGGGRGGAFFLSLALPTFLPFAILFFLNQNKRGGGGGAGVPELQTLSWGGGWGRFFCRLPW